MHELRILEWGLPKILERHYKKNILLGIYLQENSVNKKILIPPP